MGSDCARVVAPYGVSEERVRAFILSKSPWIIKKFKERSHRENFLKSRDYRAGALFLFLGERFPLEVVSGTIDKPGLAFDGHLWRATVPDDAKVQVFRALFREWYCDQAGEILGARVIHYSRLMALSFERVTIKDQKRLWGSCNHQSRRINLNWRLIMAPREVIDYVVVHEMCHLKIPNHSRRFWTEVEKYDPAYRSSQKWLKSHSLEMTLP